MAPVLVRGKELMAETRPPLIWFNGAVVPWEHAKVHVWSEVALRGTSVFEGIRAYWQTDEERYYCLALNEHLRRLFQSARLLHFPMHLSERDLIDGIRDLLSALDFREHAYVRPTIYIDEGSYAYRPDKVRMGSFIGAFAVPHPPKAFAGITCCVSSWQRSSDLSLPPRVKSGAAYQGFRLPRIEADMHGYDDVILLNNRGTVAEAAGAAVFIIRDGVAITPPNSAGNLESITRNKIMDVMTHELGIQVTLRDIDRTELYIADEVFLCGTLDTILPVIAVDGIDIRTGEPGPITCLCRDRYFEICQSGRQAPAGWLTAL